ncbi:MAG: hypothetical protein ACREDK_07410 [Thermoplasmata archaeon]
MAMTVEIVSRWNGVYLVEGDRVTVTEPIGADAVSLGAALRARRDGKVLAEEVRLFGNAPSTKLVTRDRRLVGERATLIPLLRRGPSAQLPPFDLERQREILLAAADAALADAWDPSIHVEEAVRAMSDLDDVLNKVGERLGNWAQHDTAVLDAGDVDSIRSTARRLADEPDGAPASDLAPGDPELATARRGLAKVYLTLEATRTEMEAAVEHAMPRRAPNLSRLLGPLLAAKLLSLAGGIDRLSRLPASTIQVLGAERAFFEHLRGHAPPPRHGILFLHPDLQGAPRRLRGKLARALAGKAAIAARMDREGAPVRPELLEGFQARRTAIRALSQRPSDRRKGGRSRPPFDRAALDR